MAGGLIVAAIVLLVAIGVLVSRGGRTDKPATPLASAEPTKEQQTKETGKSSAAKPVPAEKSKPQHAAEAVGDRFVSDKPMPDKSAAEKLVIDKAVSEVSTPDPALGQSKLAQEDDRAWAKASLANAAEAFDGYLRDYPRGSHATEARQAIDDCGWREACRANTLPAFKAYLREHPRGSHAKEAGQAADAWQWVEAQRGNTISAFQAYLEANPEGRFAAEARARIETLKSVAPPDN